MKRGRMFSFPCLSTVQISSNLCCLRKKVFQFVKTTNQDTQLYVIETRAISFHVVHNSFLVPKIVFFFDHTKQNCGFSAQLCRLDSLSGVYTSKTVKQLGIVFGSNIVPPWSKIFGSNIDRSFFLLKRHLHNQFVQQFGILFGPKIAPL